MADRKASVELQLKAGQFKAEAAAAKRSVDDLDDKVEKLDRDITKIPPDAAKAGAAMKLLGGDIRGVSTSITQIGDKSVAMNVLDARIKNTRGEVRKLAAEFEKTGDVEIFQKLGKTQGDLAALTRIRKNLAKSIGDGGKEGASTFASFFQGGLINAFGSLPTELKVAVGEALVVAIVAASAPIGAAINGALLAGVGLGGLGLGIAGQINNPLVQGAFGQLGQDLSAKLTSSTGSFAKPLAASAHILDDALVGILDKLEPRFEGLSHLLEPLARGIAGLATTATPGFIKALEASEPILQEIADDLPELGDAFGRFFALIADGGEGAKDGINLLFLATETLVVGIGGIIAGLSHLYEWFLAPGKAIADWYNDINNATEKMIVPLDRVKESSADAGEGMSRMGGSVEELGATSGTTAASVDYMNRAVYNTADAADQANDAFGRLFGEMMSLDTANLKVAEDFRELGSALKKSNGDLSEGTEAGQRNRRMILGMVADLEQQREAAIAAGNGTLEATQKANAAYLAQLQKLRAVAVAAGASTTAIDALIAKYQNLANQPNINKSITLTTIYKTKGDKYGGAFEEGAPIGHGFDRARASGGPVTQGQPYLVGEQGRELFVPNTSGTIVDAASTEALMSAPSQAAGNNYGFQASRGMGGGTMRFEHTLKVADGSSGRSGLASLIAGMARTGELQMSSRAIVG